MVPIPTDDSGVKILAHAHGEEGIRAAVLAGVASIEHGTYASDRTLQIMKEKCTFLVPTLSSITSLGQPGDYANPALFLRGLAMAPRRMDSVKRADALGIPIVAGVDTSYEPQSTARITREVGLLVEAGLKPWDAIRAATSVAARHLGLEGKTGALSSAQPAPAPCDVLAAFFSMRSAPRTPCRIWSGPRRADTARPSSFSVTFMRRASTTYRRTPASPSRSGETPRSAGTSRRE